MSAVKQMKKLVEIYKPKLEKVLKTDIGDVKVNGCYGMFKSTDKDFEKYSIKNGVASWVAAFLSPNKVARTRGKRIFVNPFGFNASSKGEKHIFTVHELCHVALYSCNKNIQRTYNKDLDYDFMFHLFDEGVAEFVSLDLFKGNYSIDNSKDIISIKKQRIRDKIIQNQIYYEGYRIVKNIADYHGLDKLINLIKTADPVGFSEQKTALNFG